ncbi:uncharacterized protein DUF4124 [Modicisalibacter xianhensis]|uniref:Uncharacterized protein DUF4124 n=1 Tax=Modicisalibacter xianhensis TaxID=442341 RepID=A0A4R8FIR5_9GAMM|nr:DUF4124 domain-containing protein [Halomonas xianhensis]TDX26020.1 uncharacterized protein DUF4124 [Halomonas xianhensis]
MHRFLLFFITFSFTTATNADIYKCVDSSGNTLYSGKPCETEKNKATRIIKSNISIISSTGPKATAQMELKEAGGAPVSEEESISKQLIKQRQLGIQLNIDSSELYERVGQPTSTGERAGLRDYSEHLRRSSSILINSSLPSEKGVGLLTESNNIASKLLKERSTSARATIRNQAAYKQRLASAQLGVPIY